MRRADVIVIGGGVNGTSTAFHLAARGVKNILLLERHHLAAGATGKSGSLVRLHYTGYWTLPPPLRCCPRGRLPTL